MAVKTIKQDEINKILASSRQRGQYTEELKQFIAGGEVGVEVDLSSGTFNEKKPGTVKTGFENAVKKLAGDDVAEAGHVTVRLLNDKVYLIRTDLT